MAKAREKQLKCIERLRAGDVDISKLRCSLKASRARNIELPQRTETGKAAMVQALESSRLEIAELRHSLRTSQAEAAESLRLAEERRTKMSCQAEEIARLHRLVEILQEQLP